MSTVDFVIIDAFTHTKQLGFIPNHTRKPMSEIKKEIAAWADSDKSKRIIGIEYWDANYIIWYQQD